MIIPNDLQCCKAVADLATFQNQLTDWEQRFVQSNLKRHSFTTPQKEQIARLIQTYEIKGVYEIPQRATA